MLRYHFEQYIDNIMQVEKFMRSESDTKRDELYYKVMIFIEEYFREQFILRRYENYIHEFLSFLYINKWKGLQVYHTLKTTDFDDDIYKGMIHVIASLEYIIRLKKTGKVETSLLPKMIETLLIKLFYLFHCDTYSFNEFCTQIRELVNESEN